MKYLKTYNIFEGSQRGNLYHIFDLEKCDFILKTNSLQSYKFGDISTTRNKNMNGYIGDSPISIFKLELDGDKISNNYKVGPFQFSSTEIGVGGSRTPIKLEEFEEVIKTRKLPNLKKYVNKFIIIKSRVERMKDSGWFDSDGGHFIHDHITLPEYFKIYIPKIKEMFGDIYVQEGTKIIKNDDWIESIINYPVKQINHGYSLYWKGYKKSDRGIGLTDDIQPLDDRNKEINKLVIGYNYEDLYVMKKTFKKSELPKARKNHDLYVFDFEYDNKDIMDETNDYVHIKTAHLKHIKPILKKS